MLLGHARTKVWPASDVKTLCKEQRSLSLCLNFVVIFPTWEFINDRVKFVFVTFFSFLLPLMSELPN